jgi:hypothetical protein
LCKKKCARGPKNLGWRLNRAEKRAPLGPTVRVDRRTFFAVFAAGTALAGCRKSMPFPAEDTPEGAYARIAVAISDGRPRDLFPYLEDEAQWAAHTIRKERATALARARTTHPADDLAKLEAELAVDANAPDGADVFLRIARSRGWVSRLRRDLSGVSRVERDGDRVTIVTARGSRYAMRRRTVGIYGLTMFTAELADIAEKATRDRARIEEASRDFAAAGGSSDAAAD